MRLVLERVAAYEPGTLETEEAEQAAVLVPVIERESGDHLLFTERSEDLSNHAGEMSFPGGGREPDDADREATALRESREEVGIRPDAVDVVGRLDDVPGPFGHVVRPFVGRVPDRDYAPTSLEVAAVAVISVAALADPANFSRDHHTLPGGETVELPYFRVDDHTVWGLTGHVTSNLLRVATDWRPPK